ITQVYSRLIASDLKLRLLEVYPPEHEITIISHAGTSTSQKLVLPLYKLDYREYSYADTVCVPPCQNSEHIGALLQELEGVMSILRSDGGCPWDREQTHSSLRPYLIEEAYEVLEAIDSGSSIKLADELGDLLLQVVFHAQVAKEQGDFSLAQPIKAILQKLKRRHPHVFGDVQVSGSAEVLANWQQIKRGEHGAEEDQGRSALDSLPISLPALLQAKKVQERAKQLGFDWPSIEGAWEKVHEEIAELVVAVQSEDRDAVAQEFGDLLFSLVNVARFLQIEPEIALLAAIHKFRQRFKIVEEEAQLVGLKMESASLAELDVLWDIAKGKINCRKKELLQDNSGGS
ncbi:MAG: nucleoside triphosphate pyrophosphohydrolase, partial [bacterium]|nr:nucleoside triphosphate pyrophosphohydrolase [bacterium]